MTDMRLANFDNSDFKRGRSALVEALWILVSASFVATFLPGNGLRIALLRLFGAKIGEGVIVKPSVRVKFPWRLEVGDDSWIGESVWIDNLGQVTIGSNVCVSQGAYLCTGSHDWSDEAFALMVKPITLEDGCWVGAMARIAPGVTVGRGAVLAIGSVAVRDLEAQGVFQGNPAVRTRLRS